MNGPDSKSEHVIYYFRTRDCAACNGLLDVLTAVVQRHKRIKLEELYADDDERGSFMASALGVQGVPTVLMVERIVGRYGDEFFENRVRRFFVE